MTSAGSIYTNFIPVIHGVFALRCGQVISLAGWVNIMYYVQDSHSFWDWIYFVSLIVVSVIHIFLISFVLHLF